VATRRPPPAPGDLTLSTPTRMPTLPVELLAVIDAACDRFEAAWAAAEGAEGPACEDYATELPEAARLEGLRELFAIERQYRATRGESGPHWASERPEIASLALSARDEAETLPGPAARRIVPPSGGLRLRCPRCQGSIELTADAPLDAITCSACGAAFGLTDERGDDAGLRVARFLLRDRLGVGGFGAVWRARDPELDRDVALKMPRRGELTPHEAELFFREARAAAQLAHPGIVSVFEVGRDDAPGGSGSIYLVSELVDGEPLSERMKRGRVTPREAAAIVADVAEALEYAHGRGVIHRDLKPSNIMLDRFATGGETTRVAASLGRPRLMDFGLAKRDRGEVTMTVDGQVLGTPAYMSPEQASGQVRWVDRRSDIYSAGVVLFRLLTGELPFRGTATSQIQQRLTDDPPSPRRLDDSVPADLATVCLKCLERDQTRRYASAAELAAEMRRYLAGEPVDARPLSPWGRAGRWARRRPASAAALALAALLAVVGPTAAVVISGKNADLRRQNAEYYRLIDRQEKRVDRLRERAGEADAAPLVTSDTLPGWRRQAIERLLAEHGERLLAAAESAPADEPDGLAARAAVARLLLAAGRPAGAERLLRDVGGATDEQLRAAVAELEAAATEGEGESAVARLLTAEASAKRVNALVEGRKLSPTDLIAITAALTETDGQRTDGEP